MAEPWSNLTSDSSYPLQFWCFITLQFPETEPMTLPTKDYLPSSQFPCPEISQLFSIPSPLPNFSVASSNPLASSSESDTPAAGTSLSIALYQNATSPPPSALQSLLFQNSPRGKSDSPRQPLVRVLGNEH